MNVARVCIVLSATMVASCAAFNPYIRHNSSVSSAGISRCAGETSESDAWLQYACQMLARTERARSEIVGTRSGLTATLFPMAGIVAYNATRGFNAPTNAALTAGGLAGYSATSTLAQRDRIEVYDAGLSAISCAIGKYEIARNTVSDSAERFAVSAEILKVRALIQEKRTTAKTDINLAQRVSSYSSIVDGIERWLNKTGPTRSMGPTLRSFVLTTVAQMNTQLTSTVPDNREVGGDALSTFQAQSGLQMSPQAPLFKTVIDNMNAFYKNGKSTADQLDLAIQGLINLYQLTAQNAPQEADELDLTQCKYTAVADVGFQKPIDSFQLGSGNGFDGKTVSVVRGTTFRVSVSGGVPPYSTTVAHAVGPDALDPKISGQGGSAMLEIVVPQNPGGAPGKYLITIEDATHRYSRSIVVEVPAS